MKGVPTRNLGCGYEEPKQWHLERESLYPIHRIINVPSANGRLQSAADQFAVLRAWNVLATQEHRVSGVLVCPPGFSFQ